MTHIDVRSTMEQLVPGAPRHLLTRSTGAAVRTVIEREIAGLADGSIVYLDFSHIELLDRSCADEFVAKLMRPLQHDVPRHAGYVVFDGVAEEHLETIAAVLEAHGLALVVQMGGSTSLVGAVTQDERCCWEFVWQQGPVVPETVALHTGIPDEACAALLESLARRRLLRRDVDRFLALGELPA